MLKVYLLPYFYFQVEWGGTRMNFSEVKLIGPNLQADASEVAMECTEIAHKGLTIENL